jgi:predicted PhzF superfamily epimerase YddE/YHI9
MSLAYTHVDVFSDRPFGGNSLPVFPDVRDLSGEQMLRIAQEMRHFEAVFLQPTDRPGTVRARIFDLLEELPFAGHPIIGAAAVLHQRSGARGSRNWRFHLTVPVVPGALERARISSDITDTVRAAGAQFAVLLDDSAGEIRHWNNDGLVEDVATGSAAGTIGAYRLRHGLAGGGETFVLQQGRFAGRPSTLRVLPVGSAGCVETVKVGGDVSFVGHGVIEALP